MTPTTLEQELADWLVESADQRTSGRRLVDPPEAIRRDCAEASDSVPQPVGALKLWREELRCGDGGQDAARPGTWRLDALLSAACCELNGLDAMRAGLPRAAEYWFAKAVNHITNAARLDARAA